MWLDSYQFKSNFLFVSARRQYIVFRGNSNTKRFAVHHYATSDHWPTIDYVFYCHKECMCWPFHLLWFYSYHECTNFMSVCLCMTILIFLGGNNTIRLDVHHYANSNHWPTIEIDSYDHNECMCSPFHLLWLDSYYVSNNFMSACLCVSIYFTFREKSNTIRHDVHHYATSDHWPTIENESCVHK